MGIDFLRRTAPSFHRALDRQAVALRTPTLFTSDIPSVARTASADICGGSQVEIGERVLLRLMNDKLVAQRDNLVVAEFANPPREYVSRIQRGAGVGLGEVKAVRVLSGEVEVALCE
jgi:predicted RNA-binding protein with EMAP domain